MKKIFITPVLAILSIGFAAAYPPVSEKVLKAFHRAYGEATVVNWSESSTTFVASFTVNDIRHRVVYSREGDVQTTFRYYDGSKLPSFILLEIRKRFLRSQVCAVTEITDNDGISWHVSLEDRSRRTMVEVTEGGLMRVTGRYWVAPAPPGN